MSIYEYNEEYVKRTLFEDGYDSGKNDGMNLGMEIGHKKIFLFPNMKKQKKIKNFPIFQNGCKIAIILNRKHLNNISYSEWRKSWTDKT